MEIATYLPPPLLAHLRLVVRELHTIRQASNWDELCQMTASQPFPVAVVDPRADGTIRIGGVRRLVDQSPAMAVVVYTALTPQTMQAAVELSRHGIQQIVLHRFDDAPDKFLRLLELQPNSVLAELMLDAISQSLSALPTALARAIERLFNRPGQFHGAGDLAAAAGTDVRTLYRQLEREKLATPRVWVMSARLLRAYGYLREAKLSVEEAAQRIGVGQDQLRRQMVFMIGATPARVRSRIVPEAFVAHLAARLTAPPINEDGARSEDSEDAPAD